jgi:hypothetical protein
VFSFEVLFHANELRRALRRARQAAFSGASGVWDFGADDIWLAGGSRLRREHEQLEQENAGGTNRAWLQI